MANLELVGDPSVETLEDVLLPKLSEQSEVSHTFPTSLADLRRPTKEQMRASEARLAEKAAKRTFSCKGVIVREGDSK